MDKRILKSVLTKGLGVAGDVNSVRNTAVGDGFAQKYSIAEGAASAASLAEEGAGAISKASPAVEKAMSVLGSSSAANTASKVLGGASKAAPWLAVGNMVMQGADVARDPEANRQEVEGVAEEGAAARAAYGFMNPVKAIAGAAQMVGELASTSYDNYVEAPKREKALADRLASERDERLASRNQKAQNYLASVY